jgi:hypothetical protein
MYHEHGKKMNKPVKKNFFQGTDPEQRYIGQGKAIFGSRQNVKNAGRAENSIEE